MHCRRYSGHPELSSQRDGRPIRADVMSGTMCRRENWTDSAIATGLQRRTTACDSVVNCIVRIPPPEITLLFILMSMKVM